MSWVPTTFIGHYGRTSLTQRRTDRASHLYSVVKKPTVMVWFPDTSNASTSSS